MKSEPEDQSYMWLELEVYYCRHKKGIKLLRLLRTLFIKPILFIWRNL